MRDGSQHSLSMFKYHPNVTVVDTELLLEIDMGGGWQTGSKVDHKLTLCLKSFTENVDDLVDFATRSAKIRGHKILCLHQGVRGAVMDGGKPDLKSLTVKQLKHDAFDAVVCGHYHTPQLLNDNVWFVGSPYQGNRGEAGQEKWFLSFDVDGMASVPVEDMPKFATLQLSKFKSVGECCEFLATTKDFIDLEVDPDRAREISKSNLPHNVNMVAAPVEREITEIVEVSSIDPDEAVRQWLTACGRPDLINRAMSLIPS